MSNNYYSANASIIPGEGTMYNEATSLNNNHYNNTTFSNNNTNQVVGVKLKRPVVKRKHKSKKHNKK